MPSRRVLVCVCAAVAVFCVAAATSTTVRSRSDSQLLPSAAALQLPDARRVFSEHIAPSVRNNAHLLDEIIADLVADPEAAGNSYGVRQPGSERWAIPVRLLAHTASLSGGVLAVQWQSAHAPQVQLSVQLGPGSSSSALREFSPDLRFELVQNQLDFLRLATEVNMAAQEQVLRDVGGQSLENRDIELFGAFTVNPHDEFTELRIIPTEVRVLA